MSPRTRSSGGSSNYEYVVARVRARRAALFDEDDYRKLVRMGTGEIARFMEETEYEREMNALGARYSGVDLIEYALTRNMAKHFEDLLAWAEGELYENVARYLRRFDAWNVKTVLRGIYSGADAEAIESDLIRAGELTDETLDRLASAESIEGVIEGLEGTIFYEPLLGSFEDFEAEELLVPLENAVDRTFYEQLIEDLPDEQYADRATQLYLEFLRAEIDFRNLRNALRIARSGADIDPSEYYIDGGSLFDAEEVRRLAGDKDLLVEHVRESGYGDDLETALEELAAAEDLIGFEHALDAALLEYADTLSYRYPVSITAVLSYILAKEREIDNIRAIARGRESGLQPDEIERDLVML
ncbi:V-type ATP synthase subunit C [Halorhabdus amylolytica]|uniref:V-type ATP synthase subunit C n=1 Tax=Halorhabdus amylolytica TaxID=2559573 RepID=UPI0010AAB280|nr:V-type ATP synthase subunit C [Halorhabdus amylolytica]